MRNRHVPRLCGTCGSPMAGQGDVCWNCGALWTDDASAAPAATSATPGPVA